MRGSIGTIKQGFLETCKKKGGRRSSDSLFFIKENGEKRYTEKAQAAMDAGLTAKRKKKSSQHTSIISGGKRGGGEEAIMALLKQARGRGHFSCRRLKKTSLAKKNGKK